MSPEMKNLTQQMRALADQMDQMSGGEAGGAVAAGMEPGTPETDDATVKSIMKILKEMDGNPQGGAVVKEELTDEEKKKAEEEAAKSVGKSDEGTHGDDPAETVVADRSPVDETNIKEVAKAIFSAMKSMKSKQTVQKSESNPSMAMLGIIQKQNEQISEINKAMENILEGLGIADQVRKSISTQAAQKPAKNEFDATEVKKSIEQLRSDLFGNRPDATVQKSTGWGWDAAQTDNNSDVRKSISGVLKNNLTVKE